MRQLLYAATDINPAEYGYPTRPAMCFNEGRRAGCMGELDLDDDDYATVRLPDGSERVYCIFCCDFDKHSGRQQPVVMCACGQDAIPLVWVLNEWELEPGAVVVAGDQLWSVECYATREGATQ